MNLENKRAKEKKIIFLMVEIYCRENHRKNRVVSKTLCDDCKKLLEYSYMRIDNCRHMKDKTFCSKCLTPCYNPEMKEKVKAIMKYSGPRLLFHHPIEVIKHFLV